jgi:hypothetical protein
MHSASLLPSNLLVSRPVTSACSSFSSTNPEIVTGRPCIVGISLLVSRPVITFFSESPSDVIFPLLSCPVTQSFVTSRLDKGIRSSRDSPSDFGLLFRFDSLLHRRFSLALAISLALEMIGLEDPYPDRGPYPVCDSFGIALCLLLCWEDDILLGIETEETSICSKVTGKPLAMNSSPDGGSARIREYTSLW